MVYAGYFGDRIFFRAELRDPGTEHGQYGFKGPVFTGFGPVSLRVPNDSTGVSILNPGGNLSLYNPLIDITQSLNERRTTSVLANIYSEIKFTPAKYRVNFGPQYRNYRVGTWTGPNATSHLTNRPNTAGYATQENFSWVVENLMYVDKTFAQKHKVSVTLLQSMQKSRRENTGMV